MSEPTYDTAPAKETTLASLLTAFVALVSGGRMKVALGATPTIDIGDVDMTAGGLLATAQAAILDKLIAAPASEASAAAILAAALAGDTPHGGGTQVMTCTSNTTNYTLTVVSGAYYKMIASNGVIFGGCEGTTVTDANKEVFASPSAPSDWFKAAGTTFNYSTETGDGIGGYLVRRA